MAFGSERGPKENEYPSYGILRAIRVILIGPGIGMKDKKRGFADKYRTQGIVRNWWIWECF